MVVHNALVDNAARLQLEETFESTQLGYDGSRLSWKILPQRLSFVGAAELRVTRVKISERIS